MQAAGTHPAPCARHCESTAYEIEIRRLRAELAASRHELDGAKKAARAQARIIKSLQQQRAHLNAQRDQWIEARNTLESERAANATLTEELAASRERERLTNSANDNQGASMSREAFEAWFAGYLGPLTTKAEKHSMWVQWQAARAAALEEAVERVKPAWGQACADAIRALKDRPND